jgi:sugar phosphate isomerase/epimerase
MWMRLSRRVIGATRCVTSFYSEMNPVSGISRRDFVKSSALSAALPFETTKKAKRVGYRSPNEADRGIKAGCSVVLWTQGARASLPEALKGIAQAGYEWAEGSAADLLGYEDRPAEFREMLGKFGLGWITATLDANLLDPNQGVHLIGRAVRTARLLQALDADFLTVSGDWGGALQSPPSFLYVTKRLAEMGARVFEETGLYCAYHFQESDPAQVQKLIAMSDSRYLKFCLDTLSFARLGIDHVPMIRAYGDRVIHVHLHDASGKGESERDVVIGQGRLNFASVLSALCETHYDGWVTVEQRASQANPVHDATKSRKKVQSLLERSSVSDERNLSPQTPMRPRRHVGRGDSLVEVKRAALRYFAAWGATTLVTSVGPSGLLPSQTAARRDASRKAQAEHGMHHDMNYATSPLPPQYPSFKPLFFTEEAYRDISALVDAIVPASETPGALAARADEFCDLMVWSDGKQHGTVKTELERFQSLCLKRYGKVLSELSLSEKSAFLTHITEGSLKGDDRLAADFFYRIRGLVLHAYYTGSPQGLIQELGFKGNTYITKFQGCTHSEHKG